jgi:hypothetical protein
LFLMNSFFFSIDNRWLLDIRFRVHAIGFRSSSFLFHSKAFSVFFRGQMNYYVIHRATLLLLAALLTCTWANATAVAFLQRQGCTLIDGGSPAAASVRLIVPVHVMASPAVTDMAFNLIASMAATSSTLVIPNSFIQAFAGSVDPNVRWAVQPAVCIYHTADPRQQGRAAFFEALQTKMRLVTDMVLQAHRGGSRVWCDPNSRSLNCVVLLDRIVFMDADTQVFPGWFDALVAPLLLLSNASAIPPQLSPPARKHEGGRVTNVSDAVRSLDAAVRGAVMRRSAQACVAGARIPLVPLYFQRERRGSPRDLVNTGVMLINAGAPGVVAVFLEANATFEPRKFGDQTAVQRVLRRWIDSGNDKRLIAKWGQLLMQEEREGANLLNICDPAVRGQLGWDDAVCGATAEGECPASALSRGVDYAVLSKHTVNAGTAEWQLRRLLIHHAHMGGGFKRDHLRKVLKALSTGPADLAEILNGSATTAAERVRHLCSDCSTLTGRMHAGCHGLGYCISRAGAMPTVDAALPTSGTPTTAAAANAPRERRSGGSFEDGDVDDVRRTSKDTMPSSSVISLWPVALVFAAALVVVAWRLVKRLR